MNYNLTAEEAVQLVRNFAMLQCTITHQANTRRGVTNKSAKEEEKLIRKLLSNLTGGVYTEDDVKAAITT